MILALKKKHTITCAKVNNQGYHFDMRIEENLIDVDLKPHEVEFNYKGERYIYWANMSIYLPMYFYSVEDIRDIKIDSIIY